MIPIFYHCIIIIAVSELWSLHCLFCIAVVYFACCFLLLWFIYLFFSFLRPLHHLSDTFAHAIKGLKSVTHKVAILRQHVRMNQLIDVQSLTSYFESFAGPQMTRGPGVGRPWPRASHCSNPALRRTVIDHKHNLKLDERNIVQLYSWNENNNLFT